MGCMVNGTFRAPISCWLILFILYILNFSIIDMTSKDEVSYDHTYYLKKGVIIFIFNLSFHNNDSELIKYVWVEHLENSTDEVCGILNA